jgi:predicted acyltransferase
MTTPSSPVPRGPGSAARAAPVGTPVPRRIVSIDVFRGLTMLLMLFVNDIGDGELGHIANAPWWLKHLPTEIDGLSLPDVIFPAFLFIVGLSIPLALERRIARGDSLLQLVRHILTRGLGLIFIGLCMVNGCHGIPLDAAAMGISGALWRVLLFLGIILLWNRWPDARDWTRWLWVGVRVAAAAMLAYLLWIYRADQEENGVVQVVWLQTRWWGIVGLIGWAYLVSAFIWLGCRDHGTAVAGAMALLVATHIGGKCGALAWWPSWLKPSLEGLAGMSSMAVGGMVVATLFRPNSPATTPKSRITWMLLFAAGFGAAGLLLRPLWGIHKNGATPSWTLCSVAIACAVYTLLYWLIDLKKVTRWTLLIQPAGSNTLLMYMLHPAFYSLLAVLGIAYLQTHFNEGWLGIARSAAVAAGLVAVTALLTRCRIRLQL